MFVAPGDLMLKTTGADPSTVLVFLVASTADLEKFSAASPAVTHALYRTAAPVPALKPGRYDLNLMRVTFPPGTPANAPHYRTGAALYYIVSGTGTNTIGSKVETRSSGSLIFEPYGFVHQWGNLGVEPYTFLAFNMNPEGVAPVIFGEPPKSQ
jgi:quercetin dioxygenase-like cupin family protein